MASYNGSADDINFFKISVILLYTRKNVPSETKLLQKENSSLKNANKCVDQYRRDCGYVLMMSLCFWLYKYRELGGRGVLLIRKSPLSSSL